MKIHRYNVVHRGGCVINDNMDVIQDRVNIPVAHSPLNKCGLRMSEESLTALCFEDLLLLMHMTADLRMTKKSLPLNHPMREL